MTSVGIMASASTATGGSGGGPQIITIAGNPDTDLTGDWEGGVRVTIGKAGTVTGVRYKRRTTSANDFKVRLWSSAGTKLAEVAQNPAGLSLTGQFTVNFTTPVAVTAGTYVASYGSTGPIPRFASVAQSVTNTADVTFVDYRIGGANNVFPNSATAHTFYAEPVFVPT